MKIRMKKMVHPTAVVIYLVLLASHCHGEVSLEDQLPTGMPVADLIIQAFRNYAKGGNNEKTELESQLKKAATEQNVQLLTFDIDENVKENPDIVALKTSLARMRELFGKIEQARQIYLQHKELNKTADDPGMNEYLLDTRNLYTGPMSYLDSLDTTILPNYANGNVDLDPLNDMSVLSLLGKYMGQFKAICDKKQSQQQLLHNLHVNFGMAQIKVYLIMSYVYEKLVESKDWNGEDEMKLLEKQMTERLSRAQKYFKHYIQAAARDVWRCDPPAHVEDKTYSEFKGIAQKYVIKDIDMSSDESCKRTCGDIKEGQPTRCTNRGIISKEDYWDSEVGYAEQGICTQQRKCKGALYDCEDYFAKYDELWICPSPSNSSRRYEFIQHGEASPLLGESKVIQYGRKGEKKDCSKHITYDKRQWGIGIKDAFRNCETCLCTCSDFNNPKADILVNMRPAIAATNHVIIGAGLVKQDRTLHIVIEQAKLLPDGRVDEATIKKMPIMRGRNTFAKISYKDLKTFHLELLKVPKNHVLRGLGFKIVPKTKGSKEKMFSLRIISGSFDFKTGAFSSKDKYDNLSEADVTASPNDPEVDLKDCDVPTNTALTSNVADSKKLVKLTTSDFQKDLGQTTIPFIDVQPVTVRPAVPITGAGLYWKGRQNYGGFIALRLQTYDFTPYV